MDEKNDNEPGAPGGEQDGGPREFLPPLEFQSLVFPFYTQALVKLGLIEDPVGGGTGVNLPFAQRLIDLLDLLKDRTQGRLGEEEEKFLDSCLIQLKMHYLQKTDRPKR
jgi:hypothetical protein